MMQKWKKWLAALCAAVLLSGLTALLSVDVTAGTVCSGGSFVDLF